jgi:spore coat protein U-like protein
MSCDALKRLILCKSIAVSSVLTEQAAFASATGTPGGTGAGPANPPGAGGGGVGANFQCNVTASPLAFGTINPYDANLDTAFTNVAVYCEGKGQGGYDKATGTFHGDASLQFGTGSSGKFGLREMENTATPANVLEYNIFSDTSYSSILGDGTSSTTKIVFPFSVAPLSNQTFNFTIYGRIPIQPSAIDGSYLDNVEVTLTYPDF